MPFPFPKSLSRSLCRCLLVALVTLPAHARGSGGGHRVAFRSPGEVHVRQVERAPRAAAARVPQQREAPAVQKPSAAPVPVEGQGRAPASLPAEPPPVDPAKPGRLTPDERRALRQQINEAGRDIYRPVRQ